MKTQMKITLPESFKRGLWQGAGIAIGMFATSVFAVAVTGIVTWSGGQTLTAADLNATINGLVTAVTNIPDWAKSGTSAVYTAGNVGIGTSSPVVRLDVLGEDAHGTVARFARASFPGGKLYIRPYDNSQLRIMSSGGLGFHVNATDIGHVGPIFSLNNDSSVGVSSPEAAGSEAKLRFASTFWTPADGAPRAHSEIVGGFSSNAWGNEFMSFRLGCNPDCDASTTRIERMRITQGGVNIPGSVSKGSGTFDIPHPDPNMPKESRLRHSFVESPTAGDNIYRWQVKVATENGKSYIKLPKYWKYLNTNPMVWVSSANEPSLAYGYVDTNEDMVIVQANKVGTYNVLLLGTRKDEVATSNWKVLGLEYIAKGVGEAEKILSFQDKPETGVYLKNSEIKVINERSLSLKINKLEEENANLNAQIIKSISDRELEKQRISNLESTLGKLLLASKNQTTANSEKR
jgi:hypothetical protein